MNPRSRLPLRLEQACISHGGDCVIGPIDLTIEGTGLTTVIGPNGAGKTSLLKMLHGLVPLSRGSLHWGGSEAATGQQSRLRAGQGFVFQTPVMLRRSVLDNLAYPLILHGASRARARAQAHEWLAKVGLADMARHKARALSGGERQKLALARALIRAPELLLLDEPCANLDGHATHAIEEILHAARAEGTRIVMTTHDLGQARRLADDVLFIHRGKIHERAPADRFFARPETAEARAFLKGEIVR